MVEQAGDVKPLMANTGAVHLQEHDAGCVAADRRPHRKAQGMRRHRHLFDDRTQFSKALRGIAHMCIDVADDDPPVV